MNILEIRSTVEQLLSDLLGSYTLPNGSVVPALWVDGRSGVPKGWKVNGLEASIRQYPTRTSRPLMGMVEMRKAWEVVLSQYDPAAEDMDEAVDRIMRHFPDCAVRGFPSSDREYQYARIIIPDIEIATQYRPVANE
ncbi:hypothetical protein S-CBS4_gp029 [Synechococcus phage S-CBS4]|uniref:hypothetical protein n=1 Tax=Synechococcus phage S-CBS4 TaxID=756275 RepID=UPI000246A6F5|nr:hypothetical protein S-CBS4_gp029 [Synechococcus phage S-CBS4]AEX55996.1 hypothetical protein S-CBS4_gp029 [Synechococcus phage S-CBS4]AGN30525.1 hypothetical protein SXAG_00078 [Synechococcus phage S-CBS4]